ncbi:hypothetical protein [Micromonospora sp. CPCC 205561]|uniref:hypothetical protein n=1 Tax=Micromonospora sp. CPCC 205561 TaxID=3122407 RepID=UPI002FF405E3
MRNTVKRLLAVGVMSALMALFAVPQPAMAAAFTGVIDEAGGGMSVSWSGYWESSVRMSRISLVVCDSAPNNTNEATAAFRVRLRNPSTGVITTVTAPARLKVLQGYDCATASGWELGYSQQIVSVTLWFWGDQYPTQIWGYQPAANPYA